MERRQINLFNASIELINIVKIPGLWKQDRQIDNFRFLFKIGMFENYRKLDTMIFAPDIQGYLPLELTNIWPDIIDIFTNTTNKLNIRPYDLINPEPITLSNLINEINLELDRYIHNWGLESNNFTFNWKTNDITFGNGLPESFSGGKKHKSRKSKKSKKKRKSKKSKKIRKSKKSGKSKK